MLFCRKTLRHLRCQDRRSFGVRSRRLFLTDRQPCTLTEQQRCVGQGAVSVNAAQSRGQRIRKPADQASSDLAGNRRGPGAGAPGSCIFGTNSWPITLICCSHELNRLRELGSGRRRVRARSARGVDLAVQLANLLQQIAVEQPGAPSGSARFAPRCPALSRRLAFSRKLPITRASARSRPGAERTAARLRIRAAGPDGPASGVPAF